MDFGHTQNHHDIALLTQKILTGGQEEQENLTFPPSGKVAETFWKNFAQAGLLTPPEKDVVPHQGVLGLQDVCVMLEVWGSCPFSIPLYETIVLGRMPLEAFGTETQKATFKQDDAIMTAALMEDAHFNWDHPQTQAMKKGNTWSLVGEKVCVPWGQEAHGIVISAMTNKGVSLFLIATNEIAPNGIAGIASKKQGLTIQQESAIDGTPMATLILEDTQAQALGDRVLSKAEVRWYHHAVVVGMCAVQQGLSRGALEMTIRYGRKREQFGRPIASFQAVRQRAADAWIAYRGLDVVVRSAASQMDQGLEATFDVALARLSSMEKAFEIITAAQHLHGGAGYDQDYPLYHYQLAILQAQMLFGGKSWALDTLASNL